MKFDQPIDRFSQCQAIVCDLDGTLYLDQTPVDGASLFLSRILESRRKLFYFSNNTSKSRRTYLTKLEKMGFPVDDEYLITSADCAENYLKNRSLFPRIYLVGNNDLVADFAKRGFICLSDEEALKAPLPAAVVLGFDTELTYQKIETCYNLILADIPYIATHGDILCPVKKYQFKPDVGSFISLFETATGGRRPKIVGKPYKEAVDAICSRANLPPDKIAFVGDRLYTDMRMAKQNNMAGVLVLSGETTLAMARQSPDAPDIIINSVADLIEHL
jgi:4-nitrophenyl phosphatase